MARRLLWTIWLAAATVAACNPQLAPPLHTLAGLLILDQRDPIERGGGECRGTGAYADLRSGVTVTVSDQAGNQLGTGTLRARPAPTGSDGTISAAERRRCVWSFDVPNLDARDSYSVAIASRGAVVYTRKELEDAGWTIRISLGQ
jgi:hypothetical protein